jgi:hypothetical protein
MPEVSEIVELDNGMIGRVIEIGPDSLRVELLNADETPTGETVELPLPAPEPEAEPPEVEESEEPEIEAPEGDTAEMPAAADAPAEPGALRAALDTILSALGMKRAEPVSGFKVYATKAGPRWVGWWTNNFQDKEGELFSEKAIDDYVDRVRAGLTPYPELWAYHIPGSKHGEAQFVGRIGHYAIAAGSFDDTTLGQRASDVYARAGKKYAMSHGFNYPPSQLIDGVFHQFNTFEISTLPVKAAANPYTAFEEMTKMLTEEQVKELGALFGPEIAAEIVANTEAKSKAIEAAGVAYKSFAVVADVQEDTASADVKAVKTVEASLGELIASLTEDSAAAADMTAEAMQKMADFMAAQTAQTEAMQAEVASIRALVDMRPRMASADVATELEQSALTDSIKKAVDEDQFETVLGLRVRKA